jgi:hypothetical protein
MTRRVHTRPLKYNRVRLPQRLCAIALVTLCGFGLSACSPDEDPAQESVTMSSEQPATPADPTSTAEAEEQEGTPIRIRIGEETVSATVWNTPTGQALLDQLPLTLTFEDLNGDEKVGHLPQELPMDGMPEGDDPQVSDLGYYAPWGNLVLYYGDVSYWDGIARIGHIDGDLSAIAEQTGDFTATVEAAE